MSAKKLGTTVTEFLKLKIKIRQKNAEIDTLKEQASILEKQIVRVQEIEKIKRTDVEIGSASLKETTVHSVKNWKKVWAYIFKHRDTSLIQKRLSQAILNEYLEEGIKIPGTDKMVKKYLTVGYKKGV